MRKLDQAEAFEKAHQQKIASETDKKEKQIEAEEQRILDAYRTATISPAQLGEQLEKLKARRSGLELERAGLEQKNSVQPEQVETGVKDYCAEAAKNLADFTEEQWRELLRVIVQRIIFRGNSIAIQGRIPIGADPTSVCNIGMEAPVTRGGIP